MPVYIRILCVASALFGLTLFDVALPGGSAEAQTRPGQLLPGARPTPDPSGIATGAQAFEDLTTQEKMQQLDLLLNDPAVSAAISALATQTDPVPGAALEADAADAAVTAAIDRRLQAVRDNVIGLAKGVMELPDEAEYASIVWGLETPDGEEWVIFGLVLVFVATGLAVEQAVKRATRDLRERLSTAPTDGMLQRIGRTGMRLLVDVAAIAGFALGSTGMFLALEWEPIMRLVIFTLLAAVLVIRWVNAATVFFLAPKTPQLRMLPVDDAFAKRLHGWIFALVAVSTLGFALIDVLRHLGFFQVSLPLLNAGVGVVLGLMLIAMIWQNRGRMVAALSGDQVARGAETADETASRIAIRQGMARLFPWLATVYVVVVTALWVVGSTVIFWLLIIAMVMPHLNWLIETSIARAFDHAAVVEARRTEREGDGETAPQLPAPDVADEAVPTLADWQVSPYAAVAKRATRVAMAILTLVLAAAVSGFNVWTLAADESITGRTVNVIFEVVITLLMADLLWHFVKTAIDAKLAAEGVDPNEDGPNLEADEGGGSGATRAATLLPLVRRTFQVFLGILVTMLVLAALGVDIGPLLAGAGVAGLAIGFGAQALVRDVVSGIFFLIDDAFRKGEYIEIGEIRGQVEAISIRSLKLRHHRGAVHTIPFGEIPSMTNYSRDWVIMKLEFRVPFDTDMQKVKKLIKRLGQDLVDDPVFGHNFLQPLKSQGVRRVEEFNMVLGLKFMAVPGEQWVLRREVYHRVLALFDANGIQLASRDVEVKVNRDDDDETVEQAVAAATERAIAPPPGSPGGAVPA